MQNIQKIFSDHNIKSTELKTALLQILITENKPVSVPEIQKKLAEQGLTPNKTSLYRHLETFVEKKILHTLLLNAKVVHYEFQQHHHHHFTCEACDYVKCISDSDLEKSIHAIESTIKQEGLMVKKHHFSFSGLCPTCTNN